MELRTEKKFHEDADVFDTYIFERVFLYTIIMSYIDQSTESLYVDTSGKKTWYMNFGLGDRNTGITACAKIGAKLPIIADSGTVDFLQNTFVTDYWTALYAYKTYVLQSMLQIKTRKMIF